MNDKGGNRDQALQNERLTDSYGEAILKRALEELWNDERVKVFIDQPATAQNTLPGIPLAIQRYKALSDAFQKALDPSSTGEISPLGLFGQKVDNLACPPDALALAGQAVKEHAALLKSAHEHTHD